MTTKEPTTYDALIKDLTKIVSSSNSADDALNKAKDKHAQSGDASIRALAARVATINEDLAPEAINAIADSVADAIAKGNTGVKKARKSEIKLCLEQRSNIAPIIKELDDLVSKRDDADKKINLRAAVLGSLRVTKKDGVKPNKAVESYMDTFDYSETQSEKDIKTLERLMKSESFQQKTSSRGDEELHPGVEHLLGALIAAAGGDFSAVEALVEGQGTPDAQETAEDTVEDVLGIYNDLSPDEAEIEAKLEKKAVEVKRDREVDPEFDEFDIDALVGGML